MIFGLHRLKKSDFSAVFDILMLNLGWPVALKE